jgi:trans-aconitate methyltransferase
LASSASSVRASSLIDIGSGASHLVDALLQAGWRDIAVLDLSNAGMSLARARLGALGDPVSWIVADVTQWQPERVYNIWHDRAAFHFLTEERDRAAYAERMKRALKPGGYAIIATFAPDGPERCSGLPVVRYDSPALVKILGAGLSLIESLPHEHRTPGGARQSFMFHVLQRQ